jgi:hypothetical protein
MFRILCLGLLGSLDMFRVRVRVRVRFRMKGYGA